MNPNPTTILVVDDHEIVREGVRSLLTALRPAWIISEAADGQQAIESIRNAVPDLIIMDVTMPYASGFEITSRLRRSGFDRPILIFTMHKSGRLAGETREAGAQGYVLKSEANENLVRAVDILLGGGTFFGGAPEPGRAPREPIPGIVFFLRFAPDFA